VSIFPSFSSKTFRSLLAAGFCLLILPFFAQDRTIDSLKKELAKNISDTTRCNILFFLSDHAPEPEWVDFTKTLIEISRNKISKNNTDLKFYKRKLGLALNNMGYYFQNKGDYNESIKCIKEGLAIFIALNDEKGKGISYTNLGAMYHRQNDVMAAMDAYENGRKAYELTDDFMGQIRSINQLASAHRDIGNNSVALKYLNEALFLSERKNEKYGMATALHDIAMIMDEQGDTAKSHDYILKSKKLREEIHDAVGLALNLQYLAVRHMNVQEWDKALDYFLEALKLRESVGDIRDIMMSYQGIGAFYLRKGELKNAREYQVKGLALAEKAQEMQAIGECHNYLGEISIAEKKYDEAEKYFRKALELGERSGFAELIRNSHRFLADIYTRYKKNDHLALVHYHGFIKMRDSLVNAQSKAAAVKTQFAIEYSRKEMELKRIQDEKDLINQKAKMKAEADLGKQKIISFATVLALVLILALAFFIYRNLRHTKLANKIISEQKTEVEKQKQLVETKQKEVMDSIHYAKRIQQAHLPSDSFIKRSLDKLKGN
jgi:tetratricopeptide (TPR) repeat protein